MAYAQQKLLSQNFLKDPGLVNLLVQSSSVGGADTVLEIGAGKGIITEALIKEAREVIAFELDKQLYDKLVHKLGGSNNLDLRNQDFLSANLPDKPYKVFSNIPFRLTGEIVQKLLRAPNAPQDSYLIVQKEAADKLIGGSLVSALYQPYFSFSVLYEFRRTDFVPEPGVDVVLLRIQKRANPLLEDKLQTIYEDFVTYIFSRKKPYVVRLPGDPTKLIFSKWLELFNIFLSTTNTAQQRRIMGSANKLFREQKSLEKIHRTRNDRDWKKFKV